MSQHEGDIKLRVELLKDTVAELEAHEPKGAFIMRLINQKRMELNEALNELAVWQCAQCDNAILLEHCG